MTQSNKFFKFSMIILLFIITIGLVACGGVDAQAAKEVDKAIAEIPSEVKLEDEDLIQAARNLYVRLTLPQKELVKKYEILLEKEADLQDLKDGIAAAAVDELINALPATVTLEDKTEVEEARAAFDALTENQQAKVTKIADLEAKESTIAELESEIAVQAVVDLIADLPAAAAVTLDDKADIEAARAAYADLSEEEQADVTNLTKLTDAEDKLEELTELKEEVDSVVALIEALPAKADVTLEDKADVEAARTAFDALTADQQNQVTNLSKLTNAEEKIESLIDEADLAAATAWDTLITELPTLDDITVSDKTDVEAARTAYEALTDPQKLLVSMLSALEEKETRIADLELVNPVIDLITALPAVDALVVADEADIQAARTAYDALTAAQKALVSNYQTLVDLEAKLELVKNPDLVVLKPALESVPSQIVKDFLLPTDGGVVWSYKQGEDESFYDLETGELLKVTYGTAYVTLVATYNNTSLEVKVNFGLLEEGQTAIFYVGGAASDKPADGNAWDGYGTFETQLEKAGFDKYMITVGDKVYFIAKNAFIELSGTQENEELSRATLRPYGLEADTTYNNNGNVKGTPTGYKGAGFLYYNSGSVAVTFDASNTYGRCNVPNLGFGKVPFTNNNDGTYTVQQALTTHGDGNSTGPTGELTYTLNPGDYLWTPHGWEVDYVEANQGAGYGTKLNQANYGVLEAGLKINVTEYKLPNFDAISVQKAIEATPEKIVSDTLLPTIDGVTWSYKDGEDTSIYDIESGELMKLVIENTPVVFVATLGNYSQEVTINFGVLDEGQTAVYYNNTSDSLTDPVLGWNGMTLTLENGTVMFLGEKALIDLRALAEGETALPIDVLQPYSTTPTPKANVGVKSNGEPSNPGYGALYHNPNETDIVFNSENLYGYQGGAWGHSQYGYAIIDKDGVVKENLNKDSLGTEGGINITLKPGDYLWAPHVYDKDKVTGSPFAKLTANANFAADKVVTIKSSFKTEFPVEEVKDLIANLPADVTLDNADQVVAARTAYDALSSGQQSYVTNLDALVAAENIITSLTNIKTTIDLIDALPAEITLDNEAAVVAARTAYDALTEDEKLSVTNLDKLTSAELAISNIKDSEAVAIAVNTQITNLPAEITLADEAAVVAARTAYDALNEDQKLLVTEYSKLQAAETTIYNLKPVAVNDTIAALPEVVTYEDKDDIMGARSSYEALDADQKLLVTNLTVLESAEASLLLVLQDVAEAIALATPEQVLTNYSFDTLEGDFAWSYKDGEDTTLFDLNNGTILKQTLWFAERTLVITSVDFPLVSREVNINFGYTPKGTNTSVNGTSTVPTDPEAYVLSQYHTNPWVKWTMSFVKSETNWMHIVPHALEITSDTTNFKPTLTTTNVGILYINQTGADKVVKISDTHASSHATAYKSLVIDATGKVIQVVREFTATDTITIPADGFFWAPKYADKPGVTSYSPTFDMKTGFDLDDVFDIKKGELAHMYANLEGALIDANFKFPQATISSSNTDVIANDGTITPQFTDTEVEITLTALVGTTEVSHTFTVTVKAAEALTVSAVNTVIEENPGQLVFVEGVIIGTDMDGYYLADETGVVFVREKASDNDLQVGDLVRIQGTTNVYETGGKSYTKQITGNYNVIKLDSDVHSNPLTPNTISFSDLPALVAVDGSLTDENKTSIKDNLVYGSFFTITGYLVEKKVGSYTNFYLAESLDPEAASVMIHHRSSSQNELADLLGYQITINAVVFDYNVDNGWRLGFFGEFTANLTDTDKETLAQAEIEEVVFEGMEVKTDLSFLTVTSKPYLLGVTYSFSSNNTLVVSNEGVVNPQTEDTVVVITIIATFSDTHSKTYTYNITVKVPGAPELFFSEYGEGGGSNKWIEIYNPTSEAVDLFNYSVKLYSNANTSPTSTLTFAENTMLEAGDVYVIYNSSAVTAIKDNGDASHGVANFNGDDAVELCKNDVAIDLIGVIGSYQSWTVGTGSTTDSTLVRNSNINTPNSTFTTSEWSSYDKDTFTYIGSHTAE